VVKEEYTEEAKMAEEEGIDGDEELEKAGEAAEE